ncbi:MAG: alpha/beta hydrolase [Acidobacteria bacterium]|nr:alpha/beta hydrolase [Acidobacteriota bacterium]
MSLLFIHGGMGLDHTYFRPFMDPLAERARLVYFDQRLAGRSPRDGTSPVDLACMTRDAVAVAGEACRGKVIVAGHSFGAIVALSVAASHPDLVHGFIGLSHGLSPTIGATLASYVAERGTESQKSAATQAFGGKLETDAGYVSAWRDLLPLYFHDFGQGDRGLFDRVQFSVVAFTEFLAYGIGRLDYRTELPRLRMPVLFIGGESDWCERDPCGGSIGAAKLAPNGQARLIPEAGHFGFAEQPEQFRDAINEWLDAVATGNEPEA